MKKILLIVSVVFIICAMLVVSVSAVEWSVNSRTAELNRFSGTYSGYDSGTYRYNLPNDTVVTGYEGVVPYSDLYIIAGYDGIDYAWVMYGVLNGSVTSVDIIDNISWTMGDGAVTIVSNDEGANLDDALAIFNTYIVDSLSLIETESPSLIGSILAVFDSVTSWLMVGVVLLIGIFWTGSALTPIGVLAVAGLSIGVILLVVSIITRFLKFRG